MEPYTTNVGNCARCGGDHKDLVFYYQGDQAEDRKKWAAFCPTNHQIIWLVFVEEA